MVKKQYGPESPERLVAVFHSTGFQVTLSNVTYCIYAVTMVTGAGASPLLSPSWLANG